MAKKGSAEERDLVHKLWDRNFAAMRAPASGGATKKPLNKNKIKIMREQGFEPW